MRVTRPAYNVPSKLRAAAVVFPRTRLSPTHFYFVSIYSQFELIKIKLKNVNCTFVLFLGAYKCIVCHGTF
jgi:hypothetical protein